MDIHAELVYSRAGYDGRHWSKFAKTAENAASSGFGLNFWWPGDLSFQTDCWASCLILWDLLCRLLGSVGAVAQINATAGCKNGPIITSYVEDKTMCRQAEFIVEVVKRKIKTRQFIKNLQQLSTIWAFSSIWHLNANKRNARTFIKGEFRILFVWQKTNPLKVTNDVKALMIE